MSNLKILCLPPIANTLRDLDMRFTWVIRDPAHDLNTALRLQYCSGGSRWGSGVRLKPPLRPPPVFKYPMEMK